mmetsp:Transcript_27133/g.64069  ORF Transcript_27133/g.64069 Transcript_27133/m.64069 type:complete len:83 (-) Transcript_27133:13-261(-)
MVDGDNVNAFLSTDRPKLFFFRTSHNDISMSGHDTFLSPYRFISHRCFDPPGPLSNPCMNSTDTNPAICGFWKAAWAVGVIS